MHRGRVLVFTQSLGGATALGLAGLFAAGHGGYWVLVAFELLFGVLWALDFPARRTALYALVGSGRVATAVSLETVSMQLAKMTGPVLAGIGLARLGPAACFAAMAVCYGSGLLVSLDLRARIGLVSRPSSASVASSLGEGFRAAWQEPTMRSVLIITALMNVLLFPYQSMLPVFAREVLAGGPEWLGALVAADGLGALLGALVIASRHGFLAHRRLFAGAVVVAPLLLLALAGARWRWACLLILLAMGAAESGFATMQSTLALLSAPEHLRGAADRHPLRLYRDGAARHARHRRRGERDRGGGGDDGQRPRVPGRHPAGGGGAQPATGAAGVDESALPSPQPSPPGGGKGVEGGGGLS
jgi:predicted MFS family arabinose efflux permease